MSKEIRIQSGIGEEISVTANLILYEVKDFMGKDMKNLGIEILGKAVNGDELNNVITKSFGEFIGMKNTAYMDMNNFPYTTELLELGVAKDTGLTKHSGFCEYPLWEFKKEFLEEIGGDVYKEYSDMYDRYMNGEEQEPTFEQSM